MMWRPVYEAALRNLYKRARRRRRHATNAIIIIIIINPSHTYLRQLTTSLQIPSNEQGLKLPVETYRVVSRASFIALTATLLSAVDLETLLSSPTVDSLQLSRRYRALQMSTMCMVCILGHS
mmetsp:Transcript_27363/g.63849  ORF Transcript_27363/g.63849 Transcript_27363/m.63849 type:complete len:122 (-) Transcript_27363:279-644(-)